MKYILSPYISSLKKVSQSMLFGLVLLGTASQLTGCLGVNKKEETTSSVCECPDIDIILDIRKAHNNIMEHIGSATSSIEVVMFVWKNDHTGVEILRSLIAAAKRGVDVKIVKDRAGYMTEGKETLFHASGETEHAGQLFKEYVGSRLLTDDDDPYLDRASLAMLLDEAREAGVAIHDGVFDHYARFTSGGVQKKYTHYENHMKYWIFDKETMFLTSANVGDEYLGRNDYTAHIQGGAVAALQESLHTDKDFVSSCDIDLVRNSVASTGGVLTSGKDFISKSCDFLLSAEESIYIEVPYWGDKDVIRTLKYVMKNKPHVIIDIIFPRRADVQDDLNKRTIAELFEYAQNINNDNVHLYAFPSMIHGKMTLIDGKKVKLGTGNYNPASAHMGEADLIVSDENFRDEDRKEIQENFLWHTRMSSRYDTIPDYDSMKADMEYKLQ